MASTDAVSMLKDDHKTVEQLFKRFEKAGVRAHVEKRDIVDRIIEALSMHAAIEEQLFYPMRSATPAAVPTTRLPGGVSGERGCGWVGATFLAAAMAPPRSLSALRPRSLRTIGKNSASSSAT